MPFTMTRFIFWTGAYNAGLALFLLCSPAYRALGLNIRKCSTKVDDQ